MALAQFQSTLPARGATWHGICRQRQHGISIHAPRTGSDLRSRRARINRRNFNPRSPHGERLSACLSQTETRKFQSTLPARGATPRVCIRFYPCAFQSTLPARGATIEQDARRSDGSHFNPRSPHGERRLSDLPVISGREFQSTLPARGAT